MPSVPRPTALARCGVGILLGIFGFALRVLLNPLLGESVPFLTLFPAIAASAWLAGRLAGYTTTVVGAALTNFFVIGPTFSWMPQSRIDASAVLLFTAVGMLFSWLTDLARRSSDRLEVAAAEARDSRERLRRVLDSITDGFVAVDRQWRYTYVNGAAERYFGRTAPEMLGRDCWEVFPQARGTPFEAQLRGAMADRAPRAFEIASTVHVGAWAHVRVFPSGDGLSIYFRDSTSEHEAQRQLEESRAELSRANEHLQALLARERNARAEAEEANRVRDRSLATVSHELRTPLNAIVGWTEILKNGAGDPQLLHRAIETIERNAKAQAALIGDLMDFSAILSGKVHVDRVPLDLRATVADALEAVRPAAAARQVELALNGCPAPVVVAGDRRRLEQVVANLLNNALKFTPPGGLVSASLSSVDGRATLVVQDTGEGIDPQFVSYLFQPFRQESEGSAKRHGGLGLGLAIVRQMVELHGGTVAATSDGKGRGAAFRVTLPLSASQAAHVDQPAAPDLPPVARPRVHDGAHP